MKVRNVQELASILVSPRTGVAYVVDLAVSARDDASDFARHALRLTYDEDYKNVDDATLLDKFIRHLDELVAEADDLRKTVREVRAALFED